MCTEAKPGHDFIGFSIVFPNLVMATLITVNHTTDSHLMSTVPGCGHAYTAASGLHLYILYIYIIYVDGHTDWMGIVIHNIQCRHQNRCIERQPLSPCA